MSAVQYRLKGHESFILREGWLTKGLIAVHDNARVFADKGGADELGVGTNMAKAIRYWLRTAGLTTESPKDGVVLTDFGRAVYENDLYLEDITSLWLIHINIATNFPLATSWNVFFNDYIVNSFTKDEMISGMTQALTEKTWSDSLSDRLIKDDCSAILSMYTAVKEKHPDPEDKKVSPFAVLGLLSNNGALYSREQPVFSKISPAVISYMLSPVLLNNGSLLIDEIVSGSNLPGRILHLNRVVVNEFLDALQEKGEIIINRTAGLDIVYPAAMPTQQEILNTYYRGR